MNQNLTKYKNLFLKSANTCIEELQNASKKIKSDPKESQQLEIAYRNAHSLKSECLTLGFLQTATSAKLIEYLFEKAMEKKINLNSLMIHDIEKTLEYIKKSIKNIDQYNKEQDIEKATSHLLKKYLE